MTSQYQISYHKIFILFLFYQLNFANKAKRLKHQNYLSSLFNIFGIVFFNVMPWSYRCLQFISDHHSRPLSSWTTNEHHDTSTSVGKSTLSEKSNLSKEFKGKNMYISNNKFWYTLSRKQEIIHFPRNKIIKCLIWNLKQGICLDNFLLKVSSK